MQDVKRRLFFFCLSICGKKNDGRVLIEDLKIKEGKGYDGLCASNGMDLIVRRCTVENGQGQMNGVKATGEAHVSCEDLHVIGCGGSGVSAFKGVIKLSGENTCIQGNGTWGLKTHEYDFSSKIQLVAPLTKEKISTYNGGGNWGGFTYRSVLDEYGRRSEKFVKMSCWEGNSDKNCTCKTGCFCIEQISK